MANFARSLKSPTYLSPRLRPSMPGRTISNSSDVSVSSNHSSRSDDGQEIVGSGRNTPILRGGEWNRESEDASPGWDTSREDNDAIPVITTCSRRSRPIAIELPKVKRLNSSATAVVTPPEPLSARGDLPGGYFPFHEDPTARVHRPHPFHHDKRLGRLQPSGLAADTGSLMVDRSVSQPSLEITMGQTHTPVASYLPSGFHESPQPMGKYYPSNYEQRNSGYSTLRPSVSGSLSATAKSDSQVPRRGGNASRQNPESEVRRRLQQYQRDMMAQASIAAGELLSGASGSNAKVPDGLSLQNLPIPEMRLTAPASHKPNAPRLLPLSSPGPITPMELEGLGGDYLARGALENAKAVTPTSVDSTPRTMS